MSYCVIDFETKDEYISLGWGSGWPFALKGYTNTKFILLGASIRTGTCVKAKYRHDLEELAHEILKHDTFVMHNAMYDIGCITVLMQRLGIKWNINDYTYYDTMIMSKLLNQHRLLEGGYNLEACSRREGLSVKDKGIIKDYVWDSGMYQEWYRNNHINHETGEPRSKRNRYKKDKKTGIVKPDSDAYLYQWGMENLDRLPMEIVGAYCDADVDATYDIFNSYWEQLQSFPKEFDINLYSDLLKATVSIKRDGVRVDIQQAHKTREYLQGRLGQLRSKIFKEIGYEFNINAPAQLVKALKKIGITGFTKTDLGNESVKKAWLELQINETCQDILAYKNYDKLVRDFLVKIVDYQEIHRINGSDEDRIHPHFNICGAVATGRFSSSAASRKKGQKSKELNMQQIPKRGSDKEASKYIRALFIPEEGHVWVSADYSTQEPRLAIDYAIKAGLSSAYTLNKKLQEDRNVSIHEIVAKMANVVKAVAKTIGLGLMYSMGSGKLCMSLGYKTEWTTTKYGRLEVAGPQGADLIKRYHTAFPYVKQLSDIAKDKLKTNGYIKTIGGRKLFIDPPFKINDKEIRTFEYKALSKLIQGGSADICKKSLVQAYKAGLRLLLTVHDEHCISVPKDKVEEHVKLLQDCMEHTYKIDVPMITEVTVGSNWGGD